MRPCDDGCIAYKSDSSHREIGRHQIINWGEERLLDLPQDLKQGRGNQFLRVPPHLADRVMTDSSDKLFFASS